MSQGDPAPRQILAPRAASRAGLPTTMLGVEGGSGGAIPARGNPLNWRRLVEDDLLELQLLAGPRVHSTPVTSGEYTDDGREVAGDLYQLTRVVERVRPSGGGTRARGQADDEPLDPSGLWALRGAGLIDTGLGLARLDNLITSGGFPRSEYDLDGQEGKVPAGVHTHGRFAWWHGSNEGIRGISAPLRFLGLGTPIFPDPGTTLVEPLGGELVRLWGSLSPLDLKTGKFADLEALYRADPEGYQDRIRWAPAVTLPLDDLLGDDEPPPENPPPFQPPRGPLADPDLFNPVTRGGGSGGGKPKHPDDEEGEEGEEGPREEILDGKQARRPFEEESGTNFVPGADTFIAGTGLPDPGSTLTGEAGTEGKGVKYCPLGDEPGIGWVPSPTGTPTGAGIGTETGTGTIGTTGDGTQQVDPGAGAGFVGGGVAGGLVAGLPSGVAGGALTPGAAAGLLLEDGSTVKLRGGVPALEDLTDAERVAIRDLTLPGGIARVPSPIGTLGERFSIRGWGALVARQLNEVTAIVQAALVGGRYSYYAGNIGVVNTNQRGLGVSDQFIGQHLVDPDDEKTIPPALHIWQQVEGRTRSVLLGDRPAHKTERIVTGDVTATAPVYGIKKSTGADATDTGPWIQATDSDGSHPFEVQDDGRTHAAGGLQAALEPDVEALVLSGELAEDDDTRLLVPSADGWWDVYNGTATLLGSGGSSLPSGSANDVLYHDGSDWVASSSPTLQSLTIVGNLQVGEVIDPKGVIFVPQASNPSGLGYDGMLWFDGDHMHLGRDGTEDLPLGFRDFTRVESAATGLAFVHKVYRNLDTGTPSDGIGGVVGYYVDRAAAGDDAAAAASYFGWDSTTNADAYLLLRAFGGVDNVDLRIEPATRVVRLSGTGGGGCGLELESRTTPASVTAGNVVLYTKTGDDLFYYGTSGEVALGGSGTSPPFVDTTAIAKGSADATKQVRLELDGLTTATTRVLTVPDADGTIALTSDLAAYQPLDAVLTDLAGLTLVSGDILYFNGTNLTRLAKGTDGQVLKLASGLPSWAAESGGGVTDHGALTGLSDDDHTQYLLADGTRAITGTITTRALAAASASAYDIGTLASPYKDTYTRRLMVHESTGLNPSTRYAILYGDFTAQRSLVLPDCDGTFWTSGNDGAGSTLDADLLDGQHASAFATAGHNHDASYQPLDATLTALAGLATAADKLPYFTGADTAALADLTSFARVYLLGAATASDVRTNIDAAAASHNHDGTYQPLDADLTTIAGLAHLTAREFLVSDGAGWTKRAIQAADLPDLSGTYQPLDAELTSLAALSLTGNGEKVVAVKADETGFELVAQSGGSGGGAPTASSWGADSRYGASAMTGNLTLVDGDDTVHLLDPLGAARTVTLPTPTTSSKFYLLTVLGSSLGSVTIYDHNGKALTGALGADGAAWCWTDGTYWIATTFTTLSTARSDTGWALYRFAGDPDTNNVYLWANHVALSQGVTQTSSTAFYTEHLVARDGVAVFAAIKTSAAATGETFDLFKNGADAGDIPFTTSAGSTSDYAIATIGVSVTAGDDLAVRSPTTEAFDCEILLHVSQGGATKGTILSVWTAALSGTTDTYLNVGVGLSSNAGQSSASARTDVTVPAACSLAKLMYGTFAGDTTTELNVYVNGASDQSFTLAAAEGVQALTATALSAGDEVSVLWEGTDTGGTAPQNTQATIEVTGFADPGACYFFGNVTTSTFANYYLGSWSSGSSSGLADTTVLVMPLAGTCYYAGQRGGDTSETLDLYKNGASSESFCGTPDSADSTLATTYESGDELAVRVPTHATNNINVLIHMG